MIRMTRVDEIADMIVREALERKGTLDICARICEVRMEIMLKIMEVALGIREAERRAIITNPDKVSKVDQIKSTRLKFRSKDR